VAEFVDLFFGRDYCFRVVVHVQEEYVLGFFKVLGRAQTQEIQYFRFIFNLMMKNSMIKMKTSELGCCGLNCGDCPVHIATANNDDKMKQKVAAEWSKLYSEHIKKDGLTLKDINCRGCKSEDNILVGCLSCPIRGCCREKKYDSCANCEEYETCDLLNGFYSVPSHQSAKTNLSIMRKSTKPSNRSSS